MYMRNMKEKFISFDSFVNIFEIEGYVWWILVKYWRGLGQQNSFFNVQFSIGDKNILICIPEIAGTVGIPTIFRRFLSGFSILRGIPWELEPGFLFFLF
jgi:hypothetical protein